jgi:hypothetical protein
MTIVRQLKTIYSNYAIGLFAHCIFRRLKPGDMVRANRVIVGEDGLYCIPRSKSVPSEAGDYYELTFAGSEELNLTRATLEFAKMLLRNLSIDSYEALFTYCERTDQLSRLQAQEWYGFARMVRNSLTHTQHWQFRPRDFKRLPVTWKGKTIEASMDGQELTFEFYDWWDGCELWNEMVAFADKLS